MTAFEENEIPNFGERYQVIYNKDLEVVEIRERSHNSRRPIDVPEAMGLLAKLFKRYQAQFISNKGDRNIYMFPNLFIKPREGDRIINSRTNEIYTVDQCIDDPLTRRWQGLVRLDLINPPENDDRLVFHNPDNYINFDHSFPQTLENAARQLNSDGELVEIPNLKPTVTWTIERAEPASGRSSKPFDPNGKVFKPRQVERLKDPSFPGKSVLITRQRIENLVEFGCYAGTQRLSERLTNWFLTFMDRAAPIINRMGVEQIFFYERLADDLNNAWRQPFAVRKVNYYMLTQKIQAEYESDIVLFNISLDGASSEITPRLNKEERYIADQLVTGELTYGGYRDLFYDQSGNPLFGNIDILE